MSKIWPENTASVSLVDVESGKILCSFNDPIRAEELFEDIIAATPERKEELALVAFDQDGVAIEARQG